MALQWTVVSCSSGNLSHDVPFQWCPPGQDVKRSFSAATAGTVLQLGNWGAAVSSSSSRKCGLTRADKCKQLSSWAGCKTNGGLFGTVEFQLQHSKQLRTEKKSQRVRERVVVPNSVKNEEAEVNSAAGSNSPEDVQQQQAVEKGGGGGSSSSSFLTFLCPLLKLIGVRFPKPQNDFNPRLFVAKLSRLPQLLAPTVAWVRHTTIKFPPGSIHEW